MNIHFSSNCQGDALGKFLLKSPDGDKLKVSCTQEHQIILGETTREIEAKHLADADVILYHAHLGKTPWPEGTPIKDGVVPIALPVFYNGGYFIHWASQEDWNMLWDYAQKHSMDDTVQFALNEAPMGYEQRWYDNHAKMKIKEMQENVPEWGRVSEWILEGRDWRQNMTMNHPTSIVFYRWANRLLNHLGLRPLDGNFLIECENDPNVAGLPCEETACTAAVKALGMKWGGTSRENALAGEYVRWRINNMREAKLANGQT